MLEDEIDRVPGPKNKPANAVGERSRWVKAFSLCYATIVVVAIFVGLANAPAQTVVAIAISLLAFLRTNDRVKSASVPMSHLHIFADFIVSIFLIILVPVSAFVAFFATCTIGGLGMSAMGGSELTIWALIPLSITAAVVAGSLVIKALLRPRR
jgi:hypothetical protein